MLNACFFFCIIIALVAAITNMVLLDVLFGIDMV